MFLIFVIVAALVLVLLAAAQKKSKTASAAQNFPYIKRATLFTPAERSFLGVLELAIGDEYGIYGKIRVADVLEVDRQRTKGQSAFFKISSKHFDYVICNKQDLSILCAIELDDKSHNQRNRQERDNFLVAACEAAQLPLLRFEAKQSYPVQEVREKVLQVLGVAPTVPALEKLEAKAAPQQEVKAEPTPDTTPEPICPKCAAKMVKRQATSGGTLFWGCSSYPKCRSTQAIATNNQIN